MPFSSARDLMCCAKRGCPNGQVGARRRRGDERRLIDSMVVVMGAKSKGKKQETKTKSQLSVHGTSPVLARTGTADGSYRLAGVSLLPALADRCTRVGTWKLSCRDH